MWTYVDHQATVHIILPSGRMFSLANTAMPGQTARAKVSMLLHIKQTDLLII